MLRLSQQARLLNFRRRFEDGTARVERGYADCA